MSDLQTSNKCETCDGKGKVFLPGGSIGDCLTCFATGDADIDPFARCAVCGGRADPRPPHPCVNLLSKCKKPWEKE